ncbi:oxidoreductase-like protein [Stipitochalara longipes BDJ]|nr:oxidoreductase-like protein [Stipitochalara longipes BDJ]
MPNVLIIGATRGLGASLANQYASHPSTTVYGTTRSAEAPKGKGHHEGIKWAKGIDLNEKEAGKKLVEELRKIGVDGGLDVVIITAGYFATEDFESGPKWEEEVRMYTTSSIAPPFLIHALSTSSLLPSGSKILLVSSESGSITLRHEKEGGGNYAHHASKSALNMVGKLLSLDLKDKGVVVSIVHPGFMRTEMTKGVGFDKYWDDGGAVTPDEAAKSLIEWTEKLDISKTGQYWAPRGPRDIGTADVTIGTDLPTPLHLPW